MGKDKSGRDKTEFSIERAGAIAKDFAQDWVGKAGSWFGDNVRDSFTVSDDQLAEILQTVREQLPTTEVWLMGKPQSGKSSIVCGLTGVSAEIVGRGFRPHTQHTNRYAYPSDDLPWLVFTDTVGLGDRPRDGSDISPDTALIEELTTGLEGEAKAQGKPRSRILILTVKANDFATDSLKRIVTQVRNTIPGVPCLLAITCLHEVYGDRDGDHPNYPQPGKPFDEQQVDLNRAIAAITDNFASLGDRVVPIDFTQPEDDYNPVNYGREALINALAELLPTAEATAIHRLLDEDALSQIGGLYRGAARRYMLAFSVAAATLAAVPLPFATMPVLTTLQVSLVGLLGKLYGQTLSPSQAGGIAGAIAGGFVAQTIGRELVKFIPGFGSAIAASWAAAYTWALGEGACVYFGDLMGGKKPDPKTIQTAMAQAFQEAQERFKTQDFG